MRIMKSFISKETSICCIPKSQNAVQFNEAYFASYSGHTRYF